MEYGARDSLLPINLSEIPENGNFSDDITSSASPVFVMDDALRNRTVVTSCLMFSSGVLGNVLALVLMITSPPEQRRTMFYKLMAGLALTDLFGTVATSPVVIFIYVRNDVLDSDMPLCHYFSFMLIFANFATMSLVCAMAIERYICLCRPYDYHCKLTKSYAKYAFIASWLLSLLIASLPLVGLGHNTVQFPKTWCFFSSTSREPKDLAFNIIYSIISLAAITVTFLCNIAAIWTVLALKRRQNALNASQGPGVKRYRSLAQRFAELHMVIMLFGVTVIFTVCFGPLMIFTIICQTDYIKHIDIGKTYILMIRFASFNPILDPWVYILVRRELRWKIICVFKFLLGIKHRPAPPPPQVTGNGQSPIQINRPQQQQQQKMESEMSCWAFCFHCLCDPPIQRSTTSLARPSSTWGGAANRSPSTIRRIPSNDSMLNGTPRPYVHTQPSPSEELLLIKFTNSKTDLRPNGTSETSLTRYGT